MKLLLQVVVEPKPDTYLKLKPKSPKKSPWIFSYPIKFSIQKFSHILPGFHQAIS
jgi:hypothetical protein